MKKIIAMLALACLSLVAGAQSKFDTGTHAKTALGQAEEMVNRVLAIKNNGCIFGKMDSCFPEFGHG